ncbi:helix-turn-helix transcriptional regulator [Arthrobacter sp. 92]|uniref:helix-turn-helix transcriptional regulator n=1 Tax=Arthrobacter sp. 92 TaxID=3418175 RepID=UPI003D08DD6A
MTRNSDEGEVVRDPERTGMQFPRMLTLAQVKKILNVGMPTIYALLGSQELRGVKVGGRRVWWLSEADVADYLERAYAQTKACIEASQVGEEEAAED